MARFDADSPVVANTVSGKPQNAAMADLPSIESAFATCDSSCVVCRGEQWVCEEHPGRPWGGFTSDETCCGGAGMPCPGEVGLHA